MAGASALVLVSCVASVLFFEVAIRAAYVYLPYPAQTLIREVHLYGWHGPKLGPPWWTYCVGDDYLGARNLPNLDQVRVQYGPTLYRLTTHSLGFEGLGFRTPEAHRHWDGVVVGDSFGFCQHLDIEHCWVTQLTRQSGLTLANLSVPGTGSASHSRYLEDYGRQLKPRLVIWQYWVNDPREDVLHVAGDVLPCPAPAGPETMPRDLRAFLKRSSVIANLIYKSWQHHRGGAQSISTDAAAFETTSGIKLLAWLDESAVPRSAIASTGFSMTTASIGLAARRTQATGGTFLLLIVPTNLQVYADVLPSEALHRELRYENTGTEQLIEFAREHDIAYLDLRPAFIAAAARGEVLYPARDPHWNAAGNTLAANEVARWVAAHATQFGNGDAVH